MEWIKRFDSPQAVLQSIRSAEIVWCAGERGYGYAHTVETDGVIEQFFFTPTTVFLTEQEAREYAEETGLAVVRYIPITKEEHEERLRHCFITTPS